MAPRQKRLLLAAPGPSHFAPKALNAATPASFRSPCRAPRARSLAEKEDGAAQRGPGRAQGEAGKATRRSQTSRATRSQQRGNVRPVEGLWWLPSFGAFAHKQWY